ncbi:uncharacterized protein LOC118202965 [Stegodyphus dumicola]|uniref:uncharacterized protein LOC118202965 n=1 Tax=Stegodyphus dumicola TaxID=202533 RepID=UPI0015B369D4|nr:uncharacterized protein LOC118202965 [Stegodyphus dumicola]
MDRLVSYSLIYFTLLWLLVSAQTEDSSDSTSTTVKPDPVAGFFSELGSLFLDIDETFNKQTTPKVNFEETLVQQIINENRRRRSEYFNRIRENYRSLQKRMSSAITERPLDLLKSPEVFGLNVHSKGPKSFVDISLPFLPMKMSLKSEFPPKKEKSKDEETLSSTDETPAIPEARSKSDDFEGKIEVMDTNIKVEKKGDDTTVNVSQKRLPLESLGSAIKHVVFQIPKNQAQEQLHKLVPTEDDLRRAMEKLLNDSKRTNELLNSLTDSSETPQHLASRSGITATEEFENEPKGRILGDLLFSEAEFDKRMKEVLRRSKWLIDPPSLFHRGDRIPKTENSEISGNGKNGQEVLRRISEIHKDAVTEYYVSPTSGALLHNRKSLTEPQTVYYYDTFKRQGDLFTEGYGQENLNEAPESNGESGDLSKASETMAETLIPLTSTSQPLPPMVTDKPFSPYLNRPDSIESSDSNDKLSVLPVTPTNGLKITDEPLSRYRRHPTEAPETSDKETFDSAEVPDDDVTDDYDEVTEEDVTDNYEVTGEDVTEVTDEEDDMDIILAFTPEGLAIKLEISYEIEEPLKRLHEVLKESNLTLNFPIDSENDLEPVGDDIVQLGIATDRPFFFRIVISKDDTMESVVKSLKELKDTNFPET